MATTLNKKEIRGLITALKIKGYRIFTRPYELNIVGKRSPTTIPNIFDDKINVFWTNNVGDWEGRVYDATTDAGTFWLLNPMQSKGTALLKEGQYIDSYAVGLHQGKYVALVQVKPVTVIRDYDRNAILDFYNGVEDTGMHGINVHRANETGTTKTIDKYSAGCQVFSNADDYIEFMRLVDRQKNLYGNKFTYTLIDERSYIRGVRRRGIYVIAALSIITLAYVAVKTYQNKPINPF